MEETKVILVDDSDYMLGVMEKLEAHRKALLHRAISVFICNSKGEWLIQKRALNKYHSGGLWTNASCSHPFPGESNINAATRRLNEEMGLICELKELFCFTYKAVLSDEFTEHELDHIFYGISDQPPRIDIEEVMDWKYIDYSELKNDVKLNPENYTIWFKMLFQKVKSKIS